MEAFIELCIAILLGLVQGFTEFIPISSTAHLYIFSQLFGSDVGIYATNLISLGTTFALIQYFWKDCRDLFDTKKRELWISLIIATLPIIIGSIVFGDSIDSAIRSQLLIGTFLFLGALLLFFAEKYYERNYTTKTKNSFSRLDCMIIGMFQSLALLPGMSRSGSTLAGGLLIGGKRGNVIRFSFFLSIPAFLLASLYSVYQLFALESFPQVINSRVTIDNLSWLSLFAATLVAYSSGLFALRWLIPYLSKKKSTWFIVYRVILGTGLIISSFLL